MCVTYHGDVWLILGCKGLKPREIPVRNKDLTVSSMDVVISARENMK
jgi:hypothetical protein